MYKGRRITIVIPCLNEEQSVGQVVDMALEGISRLGIPGEVIVVDNGSTDRSAAIAAEHGARVIHEKERGYGAAIRRGFREAKYSLMAMGDADLTYDFTRIDELARPVLAGEADLVLGHRMKNILPGSMPWLHRVIGNPLFSVAVRVLFWNSTVINTAATDESTPRRSAPGWLSGCLWFDGCRRPPPWRTISWSRSVCTRRHRKGSSSG